MTPPSPGCSRRAFLQASAAAVAVGPALATSTDEQGPAIPYGVQSGDVGRGAAVIWAASDRPARMRVDWWSEGRPQDVRSIEGPAALPESGMASKVLLEQLPPGERIRYRVFYRDLRNGLLGEPAEGTLNTPGTDRRDVRFVWSGDTCGQGWGINPDWGGLRLYETMRQTNPDCFVHCGDLVYADNPLSEEVPLADGSTWRNLVTPAKATVAESLEDFRGQYRYTLLDEHVRRFNADVAQYVLWDDHEVTNNWYHERVLDDPRYTTTSVALLAARAAVAQREFTPTRTDSSGRGRRYGWFPRGPLVDLFRLDLRSHRGANSTNDQSVLDDDARILGSAQLADLKRWLVQSRGLWKVIASSMPIGLVVRDGPHFEAIAQKDGPPRGRELEIAELLRFIRAAGLRNVIWITADVHYCATHAYSPERAVFTDFLPFHEFVSGPIHAGAFGPGTLDDTFGPEVRFQRVPPTHNLPPSAGYLFFGEVHVAGETGALTVTHRDLSGAALDTTVLEPA